jgi:outer membrane biosynthesis protein TonB
MIPMILIVSIIDLFFNFMQCPLHPEYSAPCRIIWINAVGYGFFLVVTIIFAFFSARKFKKVKKRIENEFFEAANHAEEKVENVVEIGDEEEINEKPKETKKVEIKKPKKAISKPDKKIVKKETKKETKKATKSSTKKESITKKKSTKK